MRVLTLFLVITFAVLFVFIFEFRAVNCRQSLEYTGNKHGYQRQKRGYHNTKRNTQQSNYPSQRNVRPSSNVEHGVEVQERNESHEPDEELPAPPPPPPPRNNRVKPPVEMIDDYTEEVDVAPPPPRPVSKYFRRTYKRPKVHYNHYPYESEEILPVRRSRYADDGYNYHAIDRPLYNLVLGILDTFHAGTKDELRRAQENERMRRSQQLYDMEHSVNAIEQRIQNITAAFLPMGKAIIESIAS